MTGRELPRAARRQHRRLDAAAREGVGAAGMEGAAFRRIDRGGHVALEHDALALRARIGDGRGRHQGLRIRVARRGEDRLLVADLDDAAEIHHGDAMRDVLDDAEIMGDEEIGEAERLAQIDEQVQDLRLHRNVERGDGLVGDDEIGRQRERARDADPLALAAREFEGKFVGGLGPQADAREKIGDLVLSRLAPRAGRSSPKARRRWSRLSGAD